MPKSCNACKSEIRDTQQTKERDGHLYHKTCYDVGVSVVAFTNEKARDILCQSQFYAVFVDMLKRETEESLRQKGDLIWRLC